MLLDLRYFDIMSAYTTFVKDTLSHRDANINKSEPTNVNNCRMPKHYKRNIKLFKYINQFFFLYFFFLEFNKRY